MDRYMANALDNYITGHYGEDQFKGDDDFDDFVENTCSECFFLKTCPTAKKFFNGEDYTPCLIVNDIMRQNEEADHKMDLAMERNYEEMEREMLIEDAGTYVSDDPNTNWENNYLQFARLIAECDAVGAIQITDDLCDTMDLTTTQIKEIIDRAQYSWEKIKEQLPKYKPTDVNFDEEKMDLEIEKAIMEDARRNGR